MKKVISFILSAVFVLLGVSCGTVEAGEGGTSGVATTTSLEASAPKDTFTFVKADDGTYSVTAFNTDTEEPHDVIIPTSYEGGNVTAISADAFKESVAISKIVIPDSVTDIGSGAFYGCSELEEIVMSKNIQKIGSEAFKSCLKLKSVDIPWNVELGQGAFADCDVLDKKIYVPQENEVVNILMVGNSFCYYYPDELFGLAKEAGIKLNICNVYYSGCTIQQHYNWWKNGESKYQFFIYNENGRRKIENCNLETCLSAFDWDVISIQDGSGTYRTGGVTGALSAREPGLTELLKLFKERFPSADLYWHHTWALQVGYERNGFAVPDTETQTKHYRDQCTLTQNVVKKHGLTVIPSGEAWQIARANELIGDTLCMADCQHDGEEGGGQYLNACVWFEMLTGRSVIGNTYRPPYNLLEEKIPVLQQAAHDAVTEGKFNKK